MFKLLRILLYFVVLMGIALYYFIYTPSGKVQGYRLLSYGLTHKAGVEVDLLSLDLHAYPYMQAELLVEDKYTMRIDGYYTDKKLNLRYTLQSNCLESKVCSIKDDVNIQGHITGPVRHVYIDGQGLALDGNISYQGTKERHAFRNVHIKIQDMNSTKLFTLLGQKAIFEGKADALLDFSIISKKKKVGHLDYAVKKSHYHGINVAVETHIDVVDDVHTFDMHFRTPTAQLHLLQGTYNREDKKALAVYLLDIQNIADLKPLLHADYAGAFYAVGELKYANKEIHMQGVSKSLGGLLDIFYDKDTLRFYLHNVPLTPLVQKLSLTPLFDTNLTGKGTYDVTHKNLLVKAHMSKLHFKASSLTQSLYKKSDIDLSHEVFYNNDLKIETKKGKLYSTLTLENKKNYIRLKKTYINSKNSSVQSHVDIQLSKYNLKGKLHLKLDKYTSSNDTYINFDGLIQKHYAVTLKGMVNEKWASMDYSIKAGRLPSHLCTIVDDVNLTGHVNGALKRLHIEGKGSMLNGTVRYEAVKVGEKLEDAHVVLKDIHAQKLSTLFGHPELPFGKVDLDAQFDVLSKTRNKGELHYVLRKSSLYTLPFSLDAKVEVDDKEQHFTADLTLASATAKLTKGYHQADTNTTHAFYTLDVKDLKALEPLFGYTYKGPFYAMGTVDYAQTFKAHGLSKTFGGFTEFNYDKDKLDIDLSKVSLKHIMNLFPYPLLLDAQTTGKIRYDFKKEDLKVNANLTNAKFQYSDVIDTIYKKSGVNMLKETFTHSTLDAHYHKDVLLANLIMENEHSHFSLTNAQMNSKNNTINAFFDVDMQKQAFSGKVYGSLDNPKVNLNLQKLIRHEMDKQLDSIMGEGNRKMMQNMPMGGVAEDVASGMGGAFMGIFF